jgi:hypothetical protein
MQSPAPWEGKAMTVVVTGFDIPPSEPPRHDRVRKTHAPKRPSSIPWVPSVTVTDTVN